MGMSRNYIWGRRQATCPRLECVNHRTETKDLVKMLVKLVKKCHYPQWNESFADMGMKGYLARKKLLFLKKHKKKSQIAVCKKHHNKDFYCWKHVLCSVETQVELSDQNDLCYIWGKRGEATWLEDIKQTVKDEGGNIMSWGCFATAGTGALYKTDSIMKTKHNMKILQRHIETSVRKLRLRCISVF